MIIILMTRKDNSSVWSYTMADSIEQAKEYFEKWYSTTWNYEFAIQGNYINLDIINH